MAQSPYHPPDLRRTLLREAEAELAEKGVEGFSLRGVAKRAGVSHAAPAHHFSDAAGLLTALATRGFEELLATQKAKEAHAPAAERFVASGLGYIDFARAHPALFRLMFGSTRVIHDDPAFAAAAGAAFAHLANHAGAPTGEKRPSGPEDDLACDSEPYARLLSAWAMVHGLADLMIGDRAVALTAMDEPSRQALLKRVIAGVVDGAGAGA